MTDVTIRFTVNGVPHPQGNKSAFGYKGKDGKIHANVVEGKGPGRAGIVAWRQAVDTAARTYLNEHPEASTVREACSLDLAFYFESPKSDPYRTRHTTRPDCDKIQRAVLDALVSGGLLADDSLVWSIHATKTYAGATDRRSPGCDIRITPNGTAEADDRILLRGKLKRRREAEKALNVTGS
jgi:Holliday junction resolvase RusA-like endonuclease